VSAQESPSKKIQPSAGKNRALPTAENRLYFEARLLSFSSGGEGVNINARPVIISLIVLMLIGGVLTALYHLAGGLGPKPTPVPAGFVPAAAQWLATLI
jgi:hypothetical protein